MKNQAYFDSPAIGSSMLSAFIKSQDEALKKFNASRFAENGKEYEDLIEEEATGKTVFSDKYFVSSINSFPDTKKPNIKSILEIIDDDDIQKAVEDGYIWNTKLDKETGKIELSGTYKARHSCLDQIKAHDYRRPVPKPDWKKLKAMFENFKLAEFDPPEWPWRLNLFKLLCGAGTKFQQAHFWESEDGAKCRMKSDIEVFWESQGEKYALLADLKVTANWPSFRTNWINSYVWQSKHYLTGFRQFCLENGIIPPDVIWYFIQESTEPYILHQFALSVEELDSMTDRYNYKLNECQEWIDAGKPKKGYSEAIHVNRYLKPV